jgi:PAS domain S-box-containing protein
MERHLDGRPARDPQEPRPLPPDQPWRDIAQVVDAATGETFFQQLVERAAAMLGADVVIVGERARGPLPAIDALAVFRDGALQPGFRYDLAGTPCAEVFAAADTCAYPRDTAARFPADAMLAAVQAAAYLGAPLRDVHGEVIGLIAALWRTPLGDVDEPGAVLRMLAGRAAAELERLRAVRSLGENAEILRAVTESTDDAIFVKDLEGRYLFVNSAASRAIGSPAAEIIGRGDASLLSADTARLVTANDRLALESRTSLIVDEFVGRGAERRVYQSTKTRFCRPDGTVLGIVGVARDVTVARRSEESRATLLAVANEIAGTLDRAELMRRVEELTAAGLPCDRVLTYFLMPEDEQFALAGHHGLPADLVGDSRGLRFGIEQPIVARVLTGESLRIESGSVDPVLPQAVLDHFRIGALAISPLVVHGRVVGALVAIRDRASELGRFRGEGVQLLASIARQLAVGVEAVDQFEARAREAEIAGALARVGEQLIATLDQPGLLDRLCAVTTDVLDSEAAIALLLDPEGDSFVPAAAHGIEQGTLETLRIFRISGKAPAVARALELRDVAQIPLDELIDSPARALARGAGVRSVTILPLCRGDEVLGMLAAISTDDAAVLSPVRQRIARGVAHLAALAIAHVRLIEELERANTVKSDFVATMSHELRTPLNVIIGYNEMLLDEAFGPLSEEHVAPLRRTGLAARELLELIDNTLDLSRLEAARVTIDTAATALGPLVEEIVFETRELAEAQRVQVGFAIERDLPEVHTDRAKLKVVLRNLLTNALKFSEGGRVSICARPRAGGLEVSVRDDGIGIPSQSLGAIFEAFRQVGGPRRHGGVGLGLYIVRRMLDMLGGTISVESACGRGSTFTVLLPAEPDPERRPAP